MRVLIALPMLAATAAQAAPETYALDPAHTQIQFQVDRFGFNNTIGVFGQVSGELILDEEHPDRSRVSARIKTESVELNHPERNNHVRGPFWLNVSEFPDIVFESDRVELTSEESADVTGRLTLMGVTLPVKMEVRLNKIGQDPVSQNKAAGFSANGALQRSDFGIETALGPVGDVVSYKIETLFIATED